MGIVILCTVAILLAMKGSWVLAWILLVVTGALAVVYENSNAKGHKNQLEAHKNQLERIEAMIRKSAK